MSLKKTVIAVCGPTASGKTDLAIDLAHKYHTEILSADSRQCFKELHIGVAKPTAEQLLKVPHHFIDSYSIFDDVNAGTFEKYALDTSSKVFETNDYLIMAGGTGLYVKAFLEGLHDVPEVSNEIEEFIRSNYYLKGFDWLQEQIEKTDSVYALEGEMQNPQRMMRALGVKLSGGKSILEFHSKPKAERNFQVQKLFLDPPRPLLYERINKRVDQMMENGLLDEVRSLLPHKTLNALQTVGYRELFDYFDNKVSLSEAIELIKRNTRHYAKRQLTWFKKYFVDEQTEIRNS